MASIKIVVSLDRKELEDVVIELVRSQLEKSIDGVTSEWQCAPDAEKCWPGWTSTEAPAGIVVSFTGKLKT